MNNLNSVLVEGVLIAAPEVSFTKEGTALCSFRLKSERIVTGAGKEPVTEANYFEVQTFTRLAEVCGEYLKKGRGVRVVGRLKQERWNSPEGQPQSKVFIVAEHVEFKPQPYKKAPEEKVEV